MSRLGKGFVSAITLVGLVLAGSGASSALAAGGDAWFETRTLPSTETWMAVAYGGGVFVALADGSDATAFSPDGIDWYPGGTATTVDSRNVQGVAYGNDRFVAVASESQATMWSDDLGRTWQQGGPAPAVQSWGPIAFGNGRFVAVAQDGNEGNTVTMWSADGASWNPASMSDDLYGLAFGNGVFVAMGIGPDDDATAYTSVDGSSWQRSQSLPSEFNAAGTLEFGNGRFVAVDAFGPGSVWSNDGQKWFPGGSVGPGNQIASLAFGQGRFVGVQPGPDMDPMSWWSMDGTAWNPGGTPANMGGFSLTYGEDVFLNAAFISRPSNFLTYSQAVGQQDVISTEVNLNGVTTAWANGGRYEVPYGTTAKLSMTSPSGGPINGPYVSAPGPCTADSTNNTLQVNASSGSCVIGVDAAGGQGYLPSYQQVKYYVTAVPGNQVPRLDPRPSGTLRRGQTVHLETNSLNGTNAGMPIQWKTLAGKKKVCVLETTPKGATRLLLRGPGKCKVQGSAARDANGNWNPVQISRSYKVR